MTQDLRTLIETMAIKLDVMTQMLKGDMSLTDPLADRARAALAVEAVGPTYREVLALRDELDTNGLGTVDLVAFARAALARYGSAPRPVPVSERLNDAHLEEIARAFLDNPVEVTAFICGARWAEYKLKPGPAHALPIPTQENADD